MVRHLIGSTDPLKTWELQMWIPGNISEESLGKHDSYANLDGLNWTETETANRRIDIFYFEIGSMRFFVSFCGSFFSLDPWKKYNDLYHSQLYHRLGQLLYLMISSGHALIRDITDSISKTVCYIYLVFLSQVSWKAKKLILQYSLSFRISILLAADWS